MKLQAAQRVLASPRQVRGSLITETQVVLRAVIKYLKDNGHGAQFTDDDKNMVVVFTHHQDVVETLDAQRWTISEEHIDVGGLYRKGDVTVLTGSVIDLKVMAVGHERAIICQA